MPIRRPKRKLKTISDYVSLSFSIPSDLEVPMNLGAARRGMNRSQYIVWLVQHDLHRPEDASELLPPTMRRLPPRIRRYE